MLQRCWQFVATERPSFSTISSDLSHMAEKPTRHIILKATKDPAKPGHISENGQVFLRALPPHALEEDEPPQKKARSSGTLRSLISSIDDTVYTRETAETVLDFTQSETENENYNNYERYLKGDIPLPLATKRRSYDETDTSGNDAKPKTKEKVRSASRKTSKTKQDVDVESVGKASGTSSTRKKRRKTPKDKAHTSFANKGLASVNGDGGGGDMSSDGAAPSITEEEDKASLGSDLSGSDRGGSETELVRL